MPAKRMAAQPLMRAYCILPASRPIERLTMLHSRTNKALMHARGRRTSRPSTSRIVPHMLVDMTRGESMQCTYDLVCRGLARCQETKRPAQLPSQGSGGQQDHAYQAHADGQPTDRTSGNLSTKGTSQAAMRARGRRTVRPASHNS